MTTDERHSQNQVIIMVKKKTTKRQKLRVQSYRPLSLYISP